MRHMVAQPRCLRTIPPKDSIDDLPRVRCRRLQTHVVSPLAAQTVTASYIYAAHYGYSDRVLHNDNQLRIFPLADPGQEPLGLQL